MNYELLQTQENDIYTDAAASGLPLGNFRWTKKYASSVYQLSVIEYVRPNETDPRRKVEPWYCMFDLQLKQTKISPAPEGPFTEYSAPTWKEHRQAAGLWLSALKRELEAPDLWASLREGAVHLGKENTPFTEEERKLLQGVIAAAKERVAKLNPPAEDLRVVEAELDGIVDDANRLSRLDWARTFWGRVKLAEASGAVAMYLVLEILAWVFDQLVLSKLPPLLGP